MGLKLSDILRLSWANFAGHKKRTIIVAFTIAILFGLVLGFNFLLNGLTTTLLETAAQPNDGKVYLEIGYQYVNLYGKDDSEIAKINNEDKLYESLKAAIEHQYSGKIVGEMTNHRGIGGKLPTFVIDASVAEVFGGELDIEGMAIDKIPVLAPMVRDDEYYETYEEFEPVAVYPTSEMGNPTLPGFHPLNLLLWKVYGNGRGAIEYMIRSAATDEFVRGLEEQKAEEYGYASVDEFLETWAPEKYYIVEFRNYEEAADFYYNSGEMIDNYARRESDGVEYGILKMDIFGRVMDVYYFTYDLRVMLVMIEILFVVVAIIIATLTFKHLIDQDAPTIALYRAMGASSANIRLIYFCYLLELCLLAVVLAIGIGLAMSGIVALTSASALAERLMVYYHLTNVPEVVLFGLDSFSLIELAAIILVAPVAMLLSLRRFSARHIAKKLKED